MTDVAAIDKMKKEYLKLLSKCADCPDFILVYITGLFDGDQKYTKKYLIAINRKAPIDTI